MLPVPNLVLHEVAGGLMSFEVELGTSWQSVVSIPILKAEAITLASTALQRLGPRLRSLAAQFHGGPVIAAIDDVVDGALNKAHTK